MRIIKWTIEISSEAGIINSLLELIGDCLMLYRKRDTCVFNRGI